MGTLSDLVCMFIHLDVGAFRLKFLNAVETALMDDWEVMVERSVDLERVANRSPG